MSFVERLPPEILAQIFCCCPREDLIHNLSSTIWTLGRICGTWRQVSITTPQIWTSVCIKLDDLRHGIETSGIIDMLRLVFDRSSGLPLHIHIILPRTRALGHHQEIVDVVREESHRWMSLKWERSEIHSLSGEIPMPTIDPLENVHDLQPLPVLREVEISANSELGITCDRIFRAIGGSPVLEKLILSEFCLREADEMLQAIPWGQLKYLGFLLQRSTVLLSVMTRILQRCDNLENLVIHQCPWRAEPYEWEPQVREPATLSTLQSLEIRRNPQWGNDLIREHIDILHITTVHALQHLGLANFDLYQDIDPFVRSIEDSCSELRSLSLSDIALSDITVEHFLRAIGGNIEILTLQGQVFDHLFDCIATDSQSTFLPKLEKLVVKLDERTVISPSLDAVIRAVSARALPPDGTSKLKVVEVDVYAEDADVGLVEELEAFSIQVKVHRIETDGHNGTEVNKIIRFGNFLYNALCHQYWHDMVNLRENMSVLDTVFTILENCSSQVYTNRRNTYRLSRLRQVLENFVKDINIIPKDYDIAKRAERLLDDRFGWNPNGRKRR